MPACACEWCGALLVCRHLKIPAQGRLVRLHEQCMGRWVETERALGHRLPGEPVWRPKKGDRK